MNIHITDDARKWFREEMVLEPGDTVRFYARYGGSSPLHEGFSLGVTVDQPMEPSVEVTIDGIRYYIEEKDEWYFNGHDLHVLYDQSSNELKFDYK